MLGPLTLADLPMSSCGFKLSWEWTTLRHLTDEPPARYWNSCTLKTCGSLEKLAENMDSALGSKVSFVDMYGTHRKFDVIQVAEDCSCFTIRHPRVMNEGIVTLKVRRVSLKLLEAQSNQVKKTIEPYFPGEWQHDAGGSIC